MSFWDVAKQVASTVGNFVVDESYSMTDAYYDNCDTSEKHRPNLRSDASTSQKVGAAIGRYNAMQSMSDDNLMRIAKDKSASNIERETAVNVYKSKHNVSNDDE